MTWRQVTILVLVVAPFLFAWFDFVVYRNGGNESTISRVLLEVDFLTKYFALVAVFAAGILVGHFFFPQHVTP